MKRLGTVLLSSTIAAGLLIAGTIWQDKAMQQALAQTAPVALTSAASSSMDSIQIFAGKGTFVRLPVAAEAVFVSEPDIADVDIKFSNMLYVFGNTPGESTIHVLDNEGNIVLSRNVVVTANIDALRATLAKLLPDLPLEVYPIRDRIAVRGTVRSASDADMALKVVETYSESPESVINMINVSESNQITLKVKVAEVRRNLTQAFGLDFQQGSGSSKMRYGTFSENAPFTVDGDGGRVFNIGQFDTVDATSLPYSIFGGFRDGTFGIDGLLTALETEGLLTLLAEPNLTTISGEVASFLAGGEFPIPTFDELTGAVRIEYKEFGVGLNFAPVLMANNRIRLRVNPIVSEISTESDVQLGDIVYPVLNTRKAETTVELGNGQSFMIAGILQNNMSENIRKFPWLSELPVLGALFRSYQYQRNDTELLIIVTPYIVEPVSSAELATPLDKIRIPDAKDRILYGQTMSNSIRPHNIMGTSAGDLSGPVGFSLD